MPKPMPQDEKALLMLQLRAVKSEVTKLQKKLIKLQTANLSMKAELDATRKELEKQLKKGHLTVIVDRNAALRP